MKKKVDRQLSNKIDALIKVFNHEHIEVRFEKGRFKSSICTVNGDKILMVNKQLDQQQTIALMESILEDLHGVLQAS